MVLLLTALIFLTFSVCFAANEPYKAYRIGPEDVLEISVWKDESLTRQVVVRPDGRISFPLIGEVEVGGHSIEWLEKEIKKRVNSYVPDVMLNVTVIQINSIKIYVTGKVARPGEYRIGRKINVMQALALAGGINAFADANNILVLRTEKLFQIRIPFRYKDVEMGENLEQNILLETGDIVVVP